MPSPVGRTVVANWPTTTGNTTRVDAERLLWGLVVALMALDVLTTWAGLQVGLQEGNVLVRAALDAYGIGGLLLIKVGVVGLAAAVASRIPAHVSPVIPLGLAIPTTLAVATNLVLLHTV